MVSNNSDKLQTKYIIQGSYLVLYNWKPEQPFAGGEFNISLNQNFITN